MISVRNLIHVTGILFLFLLSAGNLHAQDTFYVKKKNTPLTGTGVVVRDTSKSDSIVSYTVEYQREGSNIWVLAHMNGPFLMVPFDARNGKRVLFKDIIAVDANGRKYRRPDQYYSGGVWVDVKPSMN